MKPCTSSSDRTSKKATISYEQETDCDPQQQQIVRQMSSHHSNAVIEHPLQDKQIYQQRQFSYKIPSYTSQPNAVLGQLKQVVHIQQHFAPQIAVQAIQQQSSAFSNQSTQQKGFRNQLPHQIYHFNASKVELKNVTRYPHLPSFQTFHRDTVHQEPSRNEKFIQQQHLHQMSYRTDHLNAIPFQSKRPNHRQQQQFLSQASQISDQQQQSNCMPEMNQNLHNNRPLPPLRNQNQM